MKRPARYIILGILLITVIIGSIHMITIRTEFTRQIEQEYPNQTFRVGLPKIDIIYEKYYAQVKSVEDEITFGVFKSFNTGNVYNDYESRKARLRSNERLETIFRGSVIDKHIRSVSGSAKSLTGNSGSYQQINFYLYNEASHETIIKKTLEILIDNYISADLVTYTFEVEQHVYSAYISLEEMELSESEIKAKIVKIK